MEENLSPFLEYEKDIRVKEQHLILWDQLGKIQHVTFHLNDSIPIEERKYLQFLKDQFENLHPKPWDKDTLLKYYQLIGRRQEILLDNGYGACYFRRPDLREILEKALFFYNEKEYDLFAFVIMPNHVHVLLIMREGFDIEVTLGKIKKYVARQVNPIAGRRGDLWYKENYCRLMRSKEHFYFTRDYIKDNPKYLQRGEFTYWEKDWKLIET